MTTANLAAAGASISFRPQDDAAGMVEILVSGLTFDLCGLAPGAGTSVPPVRHRYGTIADQPFEAITLTPAQHIASGYAMIPVVQAMTALAAHISLPLEAQAVCWHPAETWIEPHYFARIGHDWVSGGAFPALGLTALQDNSAGLRSEGLHFFVRQELQVDNRPGEEMRDTAKLALRLIDRTISEGPFTADGAFDGPDGQRLHVELSNEGRLATIRHAG